MERWNFMGKYISEFSEIQNEVLEDFERYKRTIQKLNHVGQCFTHILLEGRGLGKLWR